MIDRGMNRIKFLREKANLSQKQLACKLGIGRSTVSKWETGVSLPTAAKLVPLAKLLGCSTDELLQKEE